MPIASLSGNPTCACHGWATPFLGDFGGGHGPGQKGDEWKHYAKERAWCRIHNASRCALFTPARLAGRPDSQGLLPGRVTRQRFSPQSVSDGGNAFEPVLCTTTTDRWSDPRVSHRVCEPWFGETWFFEKGCTSRAPPYPVELMTAGLDEESKGGLAD